MYTAYPIHPQDDHLPEGALVRRMRSLALECAPEGFARITSGRGIRRALSRTRRILLQTPADERLPVLQKAADAIALMQSAVYSHAPRGRKDLPACKGEARICRVAREILLASGMQPSAERIFSALNALQRERPLRMEELLRMPEALRAEALRLFAQACQSAAALQTQREAALGWLCGRGPLREDPVFLEQALRLSREEDLPVRHSELEQALSAQEGGAQAVVQRAHALQARVCMQLEHLPAAMHTAASLDPQRLLLISESARLLQKEEAYSLCDEESRALIRLCIGQIASGAKISEEAVVREAAAMAEEAGPDSIRAQAAWYWTEDEGRRLLLRRLGRADVRLRRRTPDPEGKMYMSALLLCAAVFSAALASAGIPPLLWPAAAIAGLSVASACINALCVRLFPPRGLLRLELPHVPDHMRTLVVIPAILSDAERARQIAEQLEILAAGERDPNVEFCLLGDFPDAPGQCLPGDGAVLSAAKQAVADANARTAQGRIHFLHRNRRLSADQTRWSGPERKRGALRALNSLLLRGENAFDAEGSEASSLQGRFRYVITLDADTRPYPGSLRRLIGAAAHPVNRLRGINVLQPHMNLSAASGPSPFVRLMAGRAGVNGYGGAVSEVYQDLCAQGGFAGKGIYDIAGFDRLAGHALPDNAILSHDLIEGFLAGSAFADDIVFLDSFPGSLRSYLGRMHRWTRGDWQLLPFLRGRTALQKFRMLDNLRMSLAAPCALLLLFYGLFASDALSLASALLLCLCPGLIPPSAQGLARAAAGLAILPNEAHCRADAVSRALYRTFVSRRNMLEWVSSADAERQSGRPPALPRIVCAALCLLLPGQTAFIWAGAVLAALFLAGAPLLQRAERLPEPAQPDDRQTEFLRQLARDTWLFFSRYTGGSGLPPDNVQFEPAMPPAARTSPTNIGLYMASCIAANELGLIGAQEMCSRIQKTAQSLLRMEKWRGMPYNWVDPNTGEPLRPRYVSGVDCGNLAACLLLCAQALRDADAPLSALLEHLAADMDFSALYDPVRRLFYIGYDAERDSFAHSHYDLLASESRILSCTAILLGKVPLSHWKHLSRACTSVPNGAAPLSWSGTMFEYLMPELFFRTPALSLLGEGCRVCVQQQKSHRPGGFWGVSESGYYAFDPHGNYQYRAFGLRSLMCKDEQDAPVAAPYASALALLFDPRSAAENLMRMHAAGFSTPCGLAEAIDFAPQRLRGGSFAVVNSAMAHHQGMLLLSCAHVLTGGKVRDHFALRPDVQAFSPLLDEAPVSRRSLSRRERPRQAESTRPVRPRCEAFAREARPGLFPADAHLIGAGNSCLYLNADGSSRLYSRDLLVTRPAADPFCPAEGFFTHIRTQSGSCACINGGKARFSPGQALFSRHCAGLDSRLTFALSPEDGALVRQIVLINRTDEPIRAELRDLAPLALCGEQQAQEHISFADLFLVCSSPRAHCMRIERRPREEGEEKIVLDLAVSGLEKGDRLRFFADRAAMLRRGAQLSDPQHVFSCPLRAQEPGAGLSPLQGAHIELDIPAHAQRTIGLTTLVSRCAPSLSPAAPERFLQPENLVRAQNLCREQQLSLLRFLDLDPRSFALFCRAASLCMHFEPQNTFAEPGAGRELLWPMGISGDLPLIAAFVRHGAHGAQEFLRLHAFLHAMGVKADTLLLCEEENGYSQPLRDELHARIAEMHLPAGHIRVLSADALSEPSLKAVRRLAALFCENGLRLPESARPLAFPKADLPPAPPSPAPEGRFSADGAEFRLRLLPGESTPQAWHNLLAGEHFGALVDETGGGAFWYENSRSGRLTGFAGDVLSSPSPLRILLEEDGAEAFSLVPCDPGAQTELAVRPGESEFTLQKNGLRASLVRCTDPRLPVHTVRLQVSSADEKPHRFRLRTACAFLMGPLPADRRALHTRFSGDHIFACGANESVGCLYMPHAQPENGFLTRNGRTGEAPFCACVFLSAAETAERALEFARRADADAIRERSAAHWDDLLGRLRIDTGEAVRDGFLGRWLPYQAISARLRAKTGPSQPGGAYGFRDQLQDLLCLIPILPEQARSHILLCASHQFAEGDVQHWWHPPRRGVRTHISDDLLFLPYVTAHYILETGDTAVLCERAPYLKGAKPADGQRDLYYEAGVSSLSEPLREHCLRAIRLCAGRTGAHGLPLMGGGDWNDGMDRIGAQGRGESVWLAQFLCVTAKDFASVCPQYADELREISARMLENIERHAWEGDRYLRAFRNDGSPVGSEKTEGGCRIDLLSQCWAVFAGCDKTRTKTAMNTAFLRLFDEKYDILRLLDPPFDGNIVETGYIAAYPPGIRENGGQYTHAACWALMALAQLGERERAWRLLHALLPMHHADTAEQAARYRAEPYVLAADISACGAAYSGRGGWTWYTGSAGWLYRAFLCGLAGYERRGRRVRMRALLDKGMEEMRLVLRCGSASYTLVSSRKYAQEDWAELVDDGAEHELHFAAR